MHVFPDSQRHLLADTESETWCDLMQKPLCIRKGQCWTTSKTHGAGMSPITRERWAIPASVPRLFLPLPCTTILAKELSKPLQCLWSSAHENQNQGLLLRSHFKCTAESLLETLAHRYPASMHLSTMEKSFFSPSGLILTLPAFHFTIKKTHWPLRKSSAVLKVCTCQPYR